jgi:hypothetical protein
MRRPGIALLGILTATAIAVPAAAHAGTAPPGTSTAAAAAAAGKPGNAVPHVIGIPGGRATAAPGDINGINLGNWWTELCADLPGYGWDPPNTPVNQYTCNGTSGDNQLWNVVDTRQASGHSLFELLNVASGQCLDPPDYGSNPAGTHLYIYYCNSNPANDNQEWFSDTAPPNGLEIVNYKSGLCLDVSGWASNRSDEALNLPLTLYPCYNPSWANSGWDDHIWNLLVFG